MTINKLNLAILGCGRISKSHIKAILRESKRSELVAICDESKEKLNSTYLYAKNLFKEKGININLQKFNNFRDILLAHKNKKIRIDLLIICTPSGMHAKQTIEAAKFDINICTEKPMALNVKDCEKMIRVCKNKKVKLFVVKQNRLNTTLQDLRAKIKKGLFGRIGIITLNVFWHRPQSYYDNDSWRGTKKFDGGALMLSLIHI